MARNRVLIIDDSSVSRKFISRLIKSDPKLEVADTAENGKVGIEKIEQCKPDIIIMDVNMPVMNGLEALKIIKADYPKIPVVMFSSLTKETAEITMEALEFGASDCITKPNSLKDSQEAVDQIGQQMLPIIHGICKNAEAKNQALEAPTAKEKIDAPDIAKGSPIEVVVIGISTGGPNALAKLIPFLPGSFSVPILIVQHMPKDFTKFLADSLNKQSDLYVHEAEDGDKAIAGNVYIAPGDYHMTLTGNSIVPKISLNQEPPENSCRPAVDVLFRSAAEIYGKHTLGIVLTGMGQDGLIGAEHISKTGGEIYVQDEATSVVWGMPKFIADAGLAKKVLPLSSIAAEIQRRVGLVRSK